MPRCLTHTDVHLNLLFAALVTMRRGTCFLLYFLTSQCGEPTAGDSDEERRRAPRRTAAACACVSARRCFS